MNAAQHRKARRDFERHLDDWARNYPSSEPRPDKPRVRCRCGVPRAGYFFCTNGSRRLVCKGCGIASEVEGRHVVCDKWPR